MWFYVWTSALKGAYLWEWPWSPWTNTKAYRPLKDDFNDYSWHWYNLAQTWTITLTTLNWAKCTKWGGWASYLQNTTAVLPSGTASRTVSLRYAEPSNSWNHHILYYGSNSVWYMWDMLTVSLNFRFNQGNTINSSFNATVNEWNLYTITWSSTNKIKIYVNGTLNTTNTSYTINTTAVSASSPIRLFNRGNNTSYPSTWYLADVIVEDKERTATEISKYYNDFKADYWK